MTITTDHLYLNDNGCCTCSDHAGHYLTASLKQNPNAQYHPTPLGTWEQFTADDIRSYGLDCDKCAEAIA